jgi:hypothetical protein
MKTERQMTTSVHAQNRARWAVMTPEHRALKNKKRRDAYVPKRLSSTPQEKVDRKRQAKKDRKKRAKEQRVHNLHRDSIPMASPHFTPQLLFPTNNKSGLRISEQMEILEYNGNPVLLSSPP